jgi:hypothetical protein
MRTPRGPGSLSEFDADAPDTTPRRVAVCAEHGPHSISSDCPVCRNARRDTFGPRVRSAHQRNGREGGLASARKRIKS